MKNGQKEFNLESHLVSVFRLFHPYTFDLIIEIVNELISEFSSKYYFNIRENRNSKLVKEYIQDHCALILYYKLSKDDRYKSNLNRYERSMTNSKSDINVKELYKEYLMFEIESYFHFTKVFSVLFSPERKQKELMKKLGIYREYKPTGNKYGEEKNLIYISLPLEQKKLIDECGGLKKSKSDLKTTVKQTIRVLEKEKLIPLHKYDPDKVYQSYLKSDYFSEHKSKNKIKTLRNTKRTQK